MPIGPLILFGGIALLIALVFAAFLMPPQKVLEKLGQVKPEKPKE